MRHECSGCGKVISGDRETCPGCTVAAWPAGTRSPVSRLKPRERDEVEEAIQQVSASSP